ncbi:hypothetical protein BDV96DRAFT_606682 [Lophiotrema nucula]|uniref:C2H2-type domain-containing protein n=1 Tax=Lophiotrema nucula TaxID=690887 RepID=A0A6A5YLZ9_9PLEO|nr:hypothetical protein BDV96DRAFT_606682 [Lophiotrema nucula]
MSRPIGIQHGSDTLVVTILNYTTPSTADAWPQLSCDYSYHQMRAVGNGFETVFPSDPSHFITGNELQGGLNPMTSAFLAAKHQPSFLDNDVSNPLHCSDGVSDLYPTDPEPGSAPNTQLEPELCFRTETKTIFICTYQNCNKRYSRIPDLRRHHRGAHQGSTTYVCR